MRESYLFPVRLCERGLELRFRKRSGWPICWRTVEQRRKARRAPLTSVQGHRPYRFLSRRRLVLTVRLSELQERRHRRFDTAFIIRRQQITRIADIHICTLHTLMDKKRSLDPL